MLFKNYYEIDSQGNPKELYALTDGDIIPDNFREYSLSLFKPKWDFEKEAWVEKEDITEKLTQAKVTKRDELSLACQNHILAGFDFKINTTTYHFSYDREAQLNFQETFQMFQNDMLKTIMWTAKLDGVHTRIVIDQITFNTLYIASLQHKQDAISRYRDILIPVLASLQTLDHIRALRWESQVNQPIDSPVVLKEDNTVDIQLGAVNEKTKSLKEENEMLTMSLLEVATMIMMAQMELEAARGETI